MGTGKNRRGPSGCGSRHRTLRARYVPAEPCTKSLKLIAVNQPEKRLTCFLIEREPRAGISSVADDLDGTHWPLTDFRDCPTNFLRLVQTELRSTFESGCPQAIHSLTAVPAVQVPLRGGSAVFAAPGWSTFTAPTLAVSCHVI
jgi:hypothetical protein